MGDTIAGDVAMPDANGCGEDNGGLTIELDGNDDRNVGNSGNPSSDDNDLDEKSGRNMDNRAEDVLDQKKLLALLKESQNAGNLIAEKALMLLIGLTGAGKTTSTLYLAGAKLEEEDVDGFAHYKPIELPHESLEEFAVSGGAGSVTKNIHATTVELKRDDGSIEYITICDTPGFGDTKGTEMEISNGLGIIHALTRAASVKPVVTLDSMGMSVARWTPLRKTLNTVIAMMGRESIDFSSFSYIFTRGDTKSSKRIQKQLSGFQKTLRENPSDILGDNVADKDILDAFLADMISKTGPNDVVWIDPEASEDAQETLQRLWSGSRLENPQEAFVNFCSHEAMGKLMLQVKIILSRIDEALQANDLKRAESTFSQLACLAKSLALEGVEQALELGRKKAKQFVANIVTEIYKLVEQMTAADVSQSTFQQLAKALTPKLQLLSQTEAICDVCDIDHGYNTVLESTVNKMFFAAQKSLMDVVGDHTLKHRQLLQVALMRLSCLAENLAGLVTRDEIQAECYKLVEKISSCIHVALSPLQKALEKLTGGSLEACMDLLVFLMDIQIMVNSPEMSKLQLVDQEWAWFHGDLAGLFRSLSKRGQECCKKLEDVSVSLKKLNDNNNEWSHSSLETLAAIATELHECRAFLLALSSSDRVLDALGNDPGPLVAMFDIQVNEYFPSFADFCKRQTKSIVETKPQTQEEANSLEKVARELLALAMAGRSSCSTLQTSDHDILVDLGGVQKDLTRYIEDPKSRPGHGIFRAKRLEPSEEELGRAATAVAKKNIHLWYAKADELRLFKIKNGHCDVPRKHPSLGIWVNNQRLEKKKYERGIKTAMTDERLEHLNSLEFSWHPFDVIWNQRIGELKKFKELHGHFRVPQKTPKLGPWVTQVRRSYKARMAGVTVNSYRLDAGRIAQLKDLGLVDDLE